MARETIIILEFGGRHNHLIARRIREANVYCEVLPFNVSADIIKSKNPKGIILIGECDINAEDAPNCSKDIFDGVPVLGINYGAHLICSSFGGKVSKAEQREYGKTNIAFSADSMLFDGIDENSTCWMDYSNIMEIPPEGFNITASTRNCTVAAMEDPARRIFCVQFHPEVVHTADGDQVLKNFLYKICGCSGDWNMSAFAFESIERIKSIVGNKKALCALSGGVDSSVAAVLMHKAIGNQLTCIFVDHGLLRKDEADQVEQTFKEKFNINLIRVNAQKRFLERLKGVTDPEAKRKIIGEEFIRVFEEEARKIGTVDYLVQGTIYPDIIESGFGNNGLIKSHHNVGGLPEHIDFKEIIEPLKELFKDEVRLLGEELGLSRELVWRQPFPGPGLAVRVIGEITEEKLNILREADAIFRKEIAEAGLDKELWQYFAILTDMRSTGVRDNRRTYDYTIALRAVNSIDAMTAQWAKIPLDVLERVSNKIVNQVEHVNRVVYDITNKPPATIEWE